MSVKKKFKLDFDGFDEMMENLRGLGKDVKPVAEKAMEATHEYITPILHSKMETSNLPAKGRYSKGESKKQIIDEKNIEWSGNEGSIDIGFSLDKSIVPIFLMKGTPTMKPVNGLNSAIYGSKTAKEVSKIQEAVFVEELERAMSKDGK